MFKRRYVSLLYLLFVVRYHDIINEDTITVVNWFKIWKLLKVEDKKSVQTYLHNILDKYHEKNKSLSYFYLDSLKSLMRKMHISLNFEEEENMFDFEECVFTKVRALKNLDTNFQLHPKERVKIKYERSWIYENKNNFFRELMQGQLLLTNKRVIVWKENENQSFQVDLDKMQKIEMLKFGLSFEFKKVKYVLRAHSNEALNVSISKILDKFGTRRRYGNSGHKDN